MRRGFLERGFNKIQNYLTLMAKAPFLMADFGAAQCSAEAIGEWMDQSRDQLLRNLRLPPLHETIVMRQQLSSLEAAMASLQALLPTEHICIGVTENCTLSIRQALESFRANLQDLTERMVEISRLEPMGRSIVQMQESVTNLSLEITQIRDAVAQIGPKISALPAMCEQIAKTVAKKAAGAAKQ